MAQVEIFYILIQLPPRCEGGLRVAPPPPNPTLLTPQASTVNHVTVVLDFLA